MSRSAKGFADFFPTAPSVLQQKRSKPSLSRRESSSPRPRDSQNVKSTTLPSSSREVHTVQAADRVTKAKNENVHQTSNMIANDDHEGPQTDLAHEIGSASSTSTSDSVFSSHQKNGKSSHLNGHNNSTEVTPLTNIDSSPQINGSRSPIKKTLYDSRQTLAGSPGSPYRNTHAKASWPSHLHSEENARKDSSQVRPARGQIKGYKITYDPTMDKSAKKKGREPQFEPFGAEVGQDRTSRMRDLETLIWFH